jgi:hypothetical protein
MKRFFTITTIGFALFVGTACSKSETKSTDKAGATATEQSKHGAKDAVPGSYEDWSDEHQVPESLDTRCDPSLAAAFKTTGDWCDEHGLPESQCLKCNPDLKIVRPPKGK